MFARPPDIDPTIPDFDRTKYGGWRPGVQREVLERDGFTCQNSDCGQYSKDLTVDHIISVWYHWYFLGGWKMTDEEREDWYNDVSNLQTLCRSCNSQKGTE
jgi:5-methylcytosine-specific restriction endonuclease McrA